MAKHTLVITQKCNLRCRYCYIEKASRDMPLATARRAIDFAFAHTAADETADIGSSWTPITISAVIRGLIDQPTI